MSTNDKDYDRIYQKARYKRVVASCILELGGKCARCGSVKSLQFDHIDPTTKRYLISSLWSRHKLLTTELKKCQLLCLKCHQEKTFRENYPLRQHGTWGMYDRAKCRCSICKAFFNKYYREYKKRKRASSSG